MSFSPEIMDKIKQLEEKYGSSGQDMLSYLEGLLHADFATYWDYIHLDVLLNLQSPKTSIPDEFIFISYHQITELYFQLGIHAIKQLLNTKEPTTEFFIRQLKRMNSYLKQCTDSFSIMVDGMDKEEFLKFRMSLLPASGFQSAQYRMLEIFATDAYNLVAADERGVLTPDSPVEDLYENFYWKRGGIELATGNKTLTLKQFEEKYTETFLKLIKSTQELNIWKHYERLVEREGDSLELRKEMRLYDYLLEVGFPLSHYRSAAKHLTRDPDEIAATGGTNWQQYLPPRLRNISLFPKLWEEEEIEDWGKKAELPD